MTTDTTKSRWSHSDWTTIGNALAVRLIHDLNSPLQNSSNMIEMLLDPAQFQPDEQVELQSAYQQLKQMKSLLRLGSRFFVSSQQVPCSYSPMMTLQQLEPLLQLVLPKGSSVTVHGDPMGPRSRGRIDYVERVFIAIVYCLTQTEQVSGELFITVTPAKADDLRTYATEEVAHGVAVELTWFINSHSQPMGSFELRHPVDIDGLAEETRPHRIFIGPLEEMDEQRMLTVFLETEPPR